MNTQRRSTRDYYASNHTPSAEAARAKYRASEKGQAAEQRYRKSAKGKATVLRGVRNHHARKYLGGAPSFSIEEEVWRVYPDRLCSYCGESATELDHVVPLADGGQHVFGNLVPACRSCNASKGDTKLIVWLAQRVVAERIQRGHPSRSRKENTWESRYLSTTR